MRFLICPTYKKWRQLKLVGAIWLVMASTGFKPVTFEFLQRSLIHYLLRLDLIISIENSQPLF